MSTVLILAASPLNEDRLRLGNEVKKIRQALERSVNRESWRIVSNEAATVEDLRRALLDLKPIVLHFSGHGGGEHGLCFEDDQGNTHLAPTEPLRKLLHHFKEDLKCVVLNACYSEHQGNSIRKEIDHVIGMRDSIGDDAATKFAVAFYDGLFAGASFRTSFGLACAAIDLANLDEGETPVFLTGPVANANDLEYSAEIPEIENTILEYMRTPFEKRYSFTTKGESIAGIMRSHYGGAMLPFVDTVSVFARAIIDEHHWKVQVLVHGNDIRDNKNFYLRIVDRSIKIDWEATSGCWSTPVKTYLALGASEPVLARVKAELGDTYLYWASDREHLYQNIRIWTINGTLLYGYVQIGTPTHRQLLKILESGNTQEITIKICNRDRNTRCALITELVSPTWVVNSDNNIVD